jgi:signal recognition particle subunit SRP54
MRAAEKVRKGQFDLSDMSEQLKQMQKMGGLGGLMGMMPGVTKIKNQLAERNLDDSVLTRQLAIISSMTPGERKHPDILKASRKKRIAAGSGTKVEEVNKLLKMHRGMADMMKIMSGGKAKGPMAGLARMMGLGQGMPSPEEMAKLAEQMPGGIPGLPGAPPAGSGTPSGLPPTMPGLPPKFPGLPGLGGPKLPGLGGLPPNFPGLGKKK